jgi:hypothetical protein
MANRQLGGTDEWFVHGLPVVLGPVHATGKAVARNLRHYIAKI